jgi:uncharacterized protein
MDFGCIKCGLCCKTVGKAIENQAFLQEPYRTLVAQFPFKTQDDGSCEKLVDGQCSVYEDRPPICNVEYIRKTYFGSQDSLEYYQKVKDSCNQLLERNNRKERL